MVVELETPPPLPEEGHWVAENLTLSPEVTVKRCVFPRKRARGMLLTCRSALVEDCLFEVPGAAVYLEGEAEYWYESGATRELVFKNNRFVNCSYIPRGGRPPLSPARRRRIPGGWFFHRRIALEGNSFFCFDERILQLRQTGEICMTDNRYRATRAYPPRKGTRYDVADCGCLREFHAFRTQEKDESTSAGETQRARPARKMKRRRSP